jgi:hypothetical protein
LALYSATVNPLPLSSPTQKTNGAARPRRLSSKTMVMEEEVTELLRGKVQLHRSVILDHLNVKGIMGGEKNQMAHLASFLSSILQTAKEISASLSEMLRRPNTNPASPFRSQPVQRGRSSNG